MKRRGPAYPQQVKQALPIFKANVLCCPFVRFTSMNLKLGRRNDLQGERERERNGGKGGGGEAEKEANTYTYSHLFKNT